MPEPGLRKELQDAIANVRRQIEVQAVSDHYIGSGQISADAIEDLQIELAKLEAALADLPPGG